MILEVMLAGALCSPPAAGNVAAFLDDGDADEAAACTSTSVLDAGKVAPCGGLLFAVSHARQCLGCVRSELPLCRATAKRREAHLMAERDALAIRLAVAESTISVAEPPSVLSKTLVGAGGVAVGILIGFVWAGSL